MRNGYKYNEGMHDSMSLIFESECAVKQIHKTIRYSWKKYCTYYLNKMQQTNYRDNNHLTNRGKQKMKEYDLVITEEDKVNGIVIIDENTYMKK
jgi:hypothetical protein